MFAGANADDFLDRLDPDLAVADGAGAGGIADDVDNSWGHSSVTRFISLTSMGPV